MNQFNRNKKLDIARKICNYRNDNCTWEEISIIMGQHAEKCRSIFRRYKNVVNENITLNSVFEIKEKLEQKDILALLDKEIILDNLKSYSKTEKLVATFNEKEKEKGYGDYFVVSDIHGMFVDKQALKKGIIEAKNKEVKKAIVVGDIFNLEVASSFPTNKDEVIKTEFNVIKEILTVLAKSFDVVYLIEGNHDARVRRLLAKKIPNGIKDLFKDIDPIQQAVNDLKNENNIDNLYYIWGNELKIGNVIFAHPDHYSNVPGKTTYDLIDTYIKENKSISAVIIGHTHQDLKKLYKGVAAFELGCMCFEPDYRMGARRRCANWTVAYSIIKIDCKGNIDYENSHVVPILK